jgi:predicted AlkP superfamily pyrophosphatase or phosphodiesterase
MMSRLRRVPTGLAALVGAILLFTGGTLSAQGVSADRENAPGQLDKPYLVLVSLDGFGWNFTDLCATPAFDRIAAQGLKAEALQPVFPTLTFPNHYSIATGLLPRNHGIVANSFRHEDGQQWYHYKDRTAVQDGRWYRAEPIWVTAEKHGMLSAAFFFVGTEADVGGVRPTHWRAFNAGISGTERVDQVLDWLGKPAEVRPHFITLYFEQVDDETHNHGAGSEQSIEAIRLVDGYLQRLMDGILRLSHGDRVYVLLVSDHGMAGYREDVPPLVLDEIVDLDGVRTVEGGPFVYLHLENKDQKRAAALKDEINRQWSCGRALRPADAPAAWHIDDSGLWPDLIVQAEPGCAVVSSDSQMHKMSAGDHGWAPEYRDMSGIFFAQGPRIPAGARPGVVQVTDIYPLMLRLLELPAPGPIDGDEESLTSLLLPDSAMEP